MPTEISWSFSSSHESFPVLEQRHGPAFKPFVLVDSVQLTNIMFGRFFLVSLCGLILLWSSVAVQQSTAVPLGRYSNDIVERELVPLVEGDEIPPVLVDLQDQVENFQLQLDQANEGEPGYVDLLEQLTVARAKLDRALRGVAVYVSSTAEPPTETATTDILASTTTFEADSATSTSTSTFDTSSGDPAPTTVVSDTPVTSDVVVAPEVTTVTPVETSVVVAASQAVTSERPLETIIATQPQSSIVLSLPPTVTSIIAPVHASATAPGKSADATVNGSTPQSTSNPATISTGKAANASICGIVTGADAGIDSSVRLNSVGKMGPSLRDSVYVESQDLSVQAIWDT
ncbi:hypothetical protein JR316_0001106 [Psilocybe cubensis]|uniref:Uncharacterized protein n=1 Tax=Psilocybe cubensis TaxID=181762 RepID=A0ACB8HI98_PSICU|nr:hypothetical protein JR316_0001106 [Psilocybe cubensis]KAH9487040.1 hypothetical protein JR316_0001106 [Psilocybe cubensis]